MQNNKIPWDFFPSFLFCINNFPLSTVGAPSYFSTPTPYHLYLAVPHLSLLLLLCKGCIVHSLFLWKSVFSTYIWRFGVNYRWERTCDVCASVSTLPLALSSFLGPFTCKLPNLIFLNSLTIHHHIIHIVTIHSSVEEQLDCFHHLTILNRTAMNFA